MPGSVGGEAPWASPLSRLTLSSLIAKDGFDLEVLFEAEYTMLAPIAGVFVAAERNTGIHRRAIEVHATGSYFRRDAARALNTALNVSGQAIGRIVGDRDSFILRLVCHHRENRTKNLVLRNCHIGRHIAEHCRSNEIAAIKALRPPGPSSEQAIAEDGCSAFDSEGLAIAEQAYPR
jgi:hypothetical protein